MDDAFERSRATQVCMEDLRLLNLKEFVQGMCMNDVICLLMLWMDLCMS